MIKAPKAAGGRSSNNYNKEVLYTCVKACNPISGDDWRQLAITYAARIGEPVRCHTVIQRFWREKCCAKMKKPTGESAPE